MDKSYKGFEKKSKQNKKIDMKAFEDQVTDIMKSTEMPDTGALGLSEDIRKRLDEADTVELIKIEEELGVRKEDVITESVSGGIDNTMYIESSVVEEVSEEGKEEDEPVQEEERVDGKFEIEISEDNMSASVSLFPSKGNGTPLTFKKLKEGLNSMNIVFGVNYELLEKLIKKVEKSKDEKSGVIIAEGSQPEDGKDGDIEYHLSESDDVLKQEEEVVDNIHRKGVS
ncbi:MAG: DUF342 domain-containing protein [Spirochaetes bacterium]|nr:DUF342 domain-containing protein [Spirochaetota bacterium]